MPAARVQLPSMESMLSVHDGRELPPPRQSRMLSESGPSPLTAVRDAPFEDTLRGTNRKPRARRFSCPGLKASSGQLCMDQKDKQVL